VQLYNGEPSPARQYVFEYSATTSWTRITHTVPGGSGLQIDNDNGGDLDLYFNLFHGTDATDNSYVNNQWNDYGGGNPQYKDNTSTWYTTNDATWEITGLQVEVGSVATDFEHLSYPDDLRRCQRYYYKLLPTNGAYFGAGAWYNSNTFMLHVDFPVFMRTNVTSVETTGTASHYRIITNATTVTCSAAPSALGDPNTTSLAVNFPTSGAGTQGQGGLSRSGNAAAFLAFSAEL